MATVVDGKNCDPRCEFRRLCQADIGNCFCAVAWTGPNAFYIEGNRVLADFCNQSCFYNQLTRNPECAADAPPTTNTTTTAPPTTTTTTTTTATTTTSPATTATTTTPPTTTTTSTTGSPADILAELCEKINMAQPLLNQLKGIFPADPATTSDEILNGF